MEPMALGSPSSSPANSPYLPSFLLGDSSSPVSTRGNTLSPTKGRSLAFGSSPSVNPTSPTDFNRSVLGQKTLFSTHHNSNNHSFVEKASNHNNSISGPPTQGLFDSLRTEMQQIQSPQQINRNQSLCLGTSFQNQSQANQSINDSYLVQTSFNVSRITSPTSNLNPHMNQNNSILNDPFECPQRKYNDFWLTVFGFPQSSISMILVHFAQCGTIVDKVFPSQNGNWVHIKFSSRLAADKALSFNEKIIGNNMIGVTYCKDKSILDKENICENRMSRVRPLTHTAYESAQSGNAVVPISKVPQKSSGIVNKAMDILFGW